MVLFEITLVQQEGRHVLSLLGMISRSRIVGVAAMTTLALTIPTAAAQAVPPKGAVTTDAAQPEDCTALYTPDIDNKVDGEPTELVLTSYTCAERGSEVQPQISKMLVLAFEDADYKGASISLDASGIFTVADCDQDGYRFSSMPSGWNDRISSYRVYNNCFGSRLYVDTNTSGHCETHYDDVHWVGATMNDKISSMRVQSIKRAC